VSQQRPSPKHRLELKRRSVSALVAVLALATTFVGAGVVTLTASPASAATIGPGNPSIPGFVGYVTASNMELGIGKLPDGRWGICTDTGGQYPWPSSNLTTTTRTNPQIGYLINRYLIAAKDNPKLAAALWWATGLDFHANSQPGAMQLRVDTMRQESPSIFSDVKTIHDRIVNEANTLAGPYTMHGALANSNANKGTVQNVGVTADSGAWVAGIPMKVTLTNATFNLTGTSTWSLNTADAPKTLGWTQKAPGVVSMKITYDELPANTYQVVWGGGNTQHVLAVSESYSRDRTDSLVDDRGWVRIKKVDEVTGTALQGAVFRVWGEVDGDKTRDSNESYVDQTTNSNGFTPNYVYYNSDPARVCYKELTAPTGYLRSGVTACLKATGASSSVPFTTNITNRQSNAPTSVPLKVTKAAEGGDPAGIIGVTVEVYLADPATNEPTGTWLKRHTFVSTDIDPTTGEASFTFPAEFDSSQNYVVVVANEPDNDGDGQADWVPVDSSVLADPVDDAAGTTVVRFEAAVQDQKIWQPQLHTDISSQILAGGDTPVDNLDIWDTGGHPIDGHGQLLATSPVNGVCPGQGDPAWATATVVLNFDFSHTGDVQDVPVGDGWTVPAGWTLPCITYVEWLDAGPLTHAVPATEAGIPAESAVIKTTPTFTTKFVGTPRVGEWGMDTIQVSDTQGATITVPWVRLETKPLADGTCPGTGAPEWDTATVAASGTATVTVDGDHDLPETRYQFTATGCSTFREGLDESSLTFAVPMSQAGLPTETKLIKSAPHVVTTVNRQLATEGNVLVDRVTVTRTTGNTVDVPWQLRGPIAPNTKGNCRNLGKAAWKHAPIAAHGIKTVHGDGTYLMGTHKVKRGGCYSYEERVKATTMTLSAPWTPLGIVEETSLVKPKQPEVPDHPYINAGGHGVLEETFLGRLFRTITSAAQPTVTIRSVGLQASLAPVSFQGQNLTPPSNIHIGGIWNAGATLDALVGTTVLVGHVSNDHDAPGEFKKLTHAERGQIVTTRASDGSVQRWKIQRVLYTPKERLPRSIFHQGVSRHLMLVTCGKKVVYSNGHFHYRDNLIVDAVRVWK